MPPGAGARFRETGGQRTRIADGLGVPRGHLGLAYDGETASFVSAADGASAGTDATDSDVVKKVEARRNSIVYEMNAAVAKQLLKSLRG